MKYVTRDQDQVLSIQQAAKLIKSSRQTVMVMVEKGIFPEVRVGNRYKFSRRVIMEYIRTGEPQGKAKPQSGGQ